MNTYEFLLALCVGIGLAAACGFRVFVPLFVVAIAARAGHVSLASNFSWIGSDVALLALGVATALEIAAYYVPWVDNLMDTIATPAAVIAGTIATASMLTDTSPMLQWSLGIIAGGGAAATVQAVTVTARAASTLTTGGIANPVVSSAEAGLATGLSIAVVALPILAVVLVIALAAFAVRFIQRKRRARAALAQPAA